MLNGDKDLADAVIPLIRAGRSGDAYSLAGHDPYYLFAVGKAPKFVRDWRVFGALQEKAIEEGHQIKGDWPSDAREGVEILVRTLSG